MFNQVGIIPKWMLTRTNRCKHKHSCYENVAFGFSKTLLYSFAIKYILSNLPHIFNLRKLLKNLTNFKTNADNVKWAFFIALTNAVYKLVICLMRRIHKSEKLASLVAGFLAGYSAKFLAEKVKLPQSMDALKPILIIPLVASLITGLVMIYIVGGPVSAAMEGLTHFLNTMGSANAVLLGVILGCMMCFDLGGPVNKAAYTFGVGLLASHTYAPMAAVMAAGMVPAMGMGLATFLAKRKFAASENEAGKASFVLGLCFISEGKFLMAVRKNLK